MKEFDLALQTLDDIIDNKTPFNEALRKIFQTQIDLRPYRGTVAGMVGCELRHHLLFEYLTKDFADYTAADKRALALALADLYFFKHIAQADMLAALGEKLDATKMEEAKPLLEKAGQEGPFIPENIVKHSNLYLSLRYNTPEWVLKIFQHYGYGVTYKVLRKNNRPFATTVRVRTSVMSVDDVKAKNPDLFVDTGVDGVLLYQGKESLRRNPLMKNGTLFAEKPVTKELIDKYRITEPKQLMIYDANPDGSLLCEAVENYGSAIGMNLAVPSLDHYASVSRLIHNKGLHNVNFFAAKLENASLLASVKEASQDLVIAAPASSHFDLIREQPDYLLHFDKESMDGLFAQEKQSLEALAPFVAEGGTLIYAIYTISKKEGHQTIIDFLANHPDFQFVEENQRFPYDAGETAFYYAVLHKATPVAKATPNLNPMVSEGMTPEFQLGADAK